MTNDEKTNDEKKNHVITPSYFSGVRYVSDGPEQLPARVEVCQTRHECSDGFITVYQESPWEPNGDIVANKADFDLYERSLW